MTKILQLRDGGSAARCARGFPVCAAQRLFDCTVLVGENYGLVWEKAQVGGIFFYYYHGYGRNVLRYDALGCYQLGRVSLSLKVMSLEPASVQHFTLEGVMKDAKRCSKLARCCIKFKVLLYRSNCVKNSFDTKQRKSEQKTL